MTQLNLFYVVLAAGGLLVSIFMIRQVYQYLRERRIPRRPGKNPITPDREPAAYWMFVCWMALGTVGFVYGTIETIRKVLEQ